MKINIPREGDIIYVDKDFKFQLKTDLNSAATAKKFGLGQKAKVEQYRYYYKFQQSPGYYATRLPDGTYEQSYNQQMPQYGEPSRVEDKSYYSWQWSETEVVLPRGTQLRISKLKPTHYRAGGFITFKVVDSSNKKLKTAIVGMSMKVVGEMDYETTPVIAEPPKPANHKGRFQKLSDS